MVMPGVPRTGLQGKHRALSLRVTSGDECVYRGWPPLSLTLAVLWGKPSDLEAFPRGFLELSMVPSTGALEVA